MLRLLICYALLALLGGANLIAADDRHVILITMDGFPSYEFQDARSPIPNIRKLAAEGVSAADGMRAANPTVTWPNHTTLVTGVFPAKHSVLYNGLFVRGTDGASGHIDPARDQSELVAVPTIWDIAHKAGLSTAAINWPCSRNAPGLDDSFPDVLNGVDHMTPVLKKDLLEAGILPSASQFGFARMSAPQHDQIWTAATCYLIKHRKPNLLLLHMLLTDTVQHQYGPQSTAAYTAMAVVDQELSQILTALDEAGIRDKTTVILTSDHGFARFNRLIHPSTILRKSGMGPRRIQIVPEGGTAFVYFNDPGTAEALAREIPAFFKDHEGVADVITPDRFAAMGLPTLDKNPRMANLVLTARDGYSFGAGFGGDEITTFPPPFTFGSHGYVNSNVRMNAMFIAAGRGIIKGTKLETFQNTDVAPTIAKLLGLTMGAVDGKPLDAILSKD